MIIRFVILFLLLAVPGMSFGQSTLNFPRAFTPADLASTGFAIVNPNGSNAAVTFTLFSQTGAVLGTSPQTVLARGQFSRLGAGAGQLFANPTEAGWIQATSPVSGLQGFWLGGDFTTFTDGAEAAADARNIVFPLVAPQTEINIANLGIATNNITIRLFGTAGTELAAAVARSIPIAGIFKENAAALFPTANLENATHIKVEGSANVAGTAVMTGYLVNPSWAVVNGVNAASTVTEANFPHVVSGAGFGGNYTTVVGATNLSSAGQTVSVTYTPSASSGGSPVTVQRTIPVNGSFRETASSLFGLSAYTDGWVKIAGTAALTGFVAYSDSVAGGLAVVPVQATARTALLFAHVADGPPSWLTGLALLNASSTNANVEVFVMSTDGALVGGAENVPTARFTLNAGTKTAQLLRQIVPAAEGKNSGFVFVRTTNNVPLYGIELFFRGDLAILSNVTAGGLASGITFTPPAPAAPLTLTSASPTTVVRNGTLTLTGTGFSTNAASNVVVFTGSSGTVNATASTATSTSLTVTVPATAISGPVLVQTAGGSSPSIVVQVTASASALVQSTVAVSGAATTSGVDIYVPAPAGTLNATEIGVFDVGASTFAYGTSAVEINRGQTKEIVLNGSGISQANGTTLTISGSGITVSNVRYQGTFMIVRVVVDANATPGARNVVVTNSNLDTAVLTGGLFIR